MGTVQNVGQILQQNRLIRKLRLVKKHLSSKLWKSLLKCMLLKIVKLFQYFKMFTVIKRKFQMKMKLVKIFGNKLIFITVRPNTPYVVISSEVIKSTLIMSDKESSIKRVTS